MATTTPTFGRGVTTTLLQARQLLELIDEHGTDAAAVGESFDAWCTEQIKPWVDDHVHMDESTRRRWAGEPIDLRRPLPSDLILAAAAADPQHRRRRARVPGHDRPARVPAHRRAPASAVYATGWRPPFAPGPTRDELADVIRAAQPAGAR